LRAMGTTISSGATAAFSGAVASSGLDSDLRFSDGMRPESEVRNRLRAGGRRIRTLGPLWPRSVRQGPTVSPLPLQTHSRQPRSLADYREASVRNSSALKRIDADARFSSRCAIEEVPGMGSMAGERRSSQASAIWLGVAPWL
jgi:hypothetical protein